MALPAWLIRSIQTPIASFESIAVQLDGRVLVVGDFTSLSPNGGAAVVRNHIARLNADGTLDMVFNPNANGDVYTIAVQADGNVLVGGDFFGANCIGGQTRNFLARLDATTGLADSFDPNASNAVSTNGRANRWQDLDRRFLSKYRRTDAS